MKFLKDNVLDDSKSLVSSDEWRLIYSLDKKKFMLIKLLIEVFIACAYAFGLGYSLFFLDNPIKIGALFIPILIIGSLFIIIPHELLHGLCYPIKKNITIIYTLSKLKIILYTRDIISKSRILILLILPFILLSIIPSIIIYVFDFNLLLYALASANAIRCGQDLLNFIFIIKNTPKNSSFKINQQGIYLYN